jgi:hypothetical protein
MFMKKNAVIFGASKSGEAAYYFLGDQYEFLFYCDNDPLKQGTTFQGLPVKSPKELSSIDQDVDVIVASARFLEILDQLDTMGIRNYKVFKVGLQNTTLEDTLIREYPLRMIDFGAFLMQLGSISLKNVSFMRVSSGVLDYALLRALMLHFGFKSYLEIGTWMGESLSAVSDLAEVCYSISLPDDDPRVVKAFENVHQKDNFSRYFSKKLPNVIHFYEDSQTFDFSRIPGPIDLVLVDGDHSFEGIINDTKNVFTIIDPERSIVVWHDFLQWANRFTAVTVNAVFEALPPKYHNNIFAVEHTKCGIYVPDRYLSQFAIGVDRKSIYSYETTIKPQLHRLDS